MYIRINELEIKTSVPYIDALTKIFHFTEHGNKNIYLPSTLDIFFSEANSLISHQVCHKLLSITNSVKLGFGNKLGLYCSPLTQCINESANFRFL